MEEQGADLAYARHNHQGARNHIEQTRISLPFTKSISFQHQNIYLHTTQLAIKPYLGNHKKKNPSKYTLKRTVTISDFKIQTPPQPPSQLEPPSQSKQPLAVSPGGLGLVLRQQHTSPTNSMNPDAEANACIHGQLKQYPISLLVQDSAERTFPLHFSYHHLIQSIANLPQSLGGCSLPAPNLCPPTHTHTHIYICQYIKSILLQTVDGDKYLYQENNTRGLGEGKHPVVSFIARHCRQHGIEIIWG